MKKVIVFLLVFAMIGILALAFTGCKDNNKPTIESIQVYVPDGGPALGMAYLMKEYAEIDGVNVEYNIRSDTAQLTAAEQLVAAVSNGDADVAIMPTNLAAKLYNAGKEIVLVGTNSNGLLYLVSDKEGTITLDDLKGEVVYMVGQGGTPEAVLRKVLAANDIECVVAELDSNDKPISVEGKVALYYSAGTVVINGLADGSIHNAVLGEPAVSTALVRGAAKNIKIALDLQALWKEATNGTDDGYPQTALVVKKSLATSYKDIVEKIAKLTIDGGAALIADATEYVDYLRVEMSSTQVPPTLKQAGVLRANIDPRFGSVAKGQIEAYLTILKDFDNKLIGGKLPDAGFYYDDGGVLESYRTSVKNTAK